jgi:hypothetical protein
MRAVTWSLFASRKALNSITIDYKNGFVQAFHRDFKDNNTFYIYSDLSNYSMVATTSNMVKSLSTHQDWDDKTLHGIFSAIWYRKPLGHVTGEKIRKAMKIAPEDLINIEGLSQVPDGVASKFTDSPLLPNSTKPPPKLKMAVDCEDDIIRFGAEWLQRTYGNHFPNSTHEV